MSIRPKHQSPALSRRPVSFRGENDLLDFKALTEIERLKGELEKQNSTPPEQGESISPAPGERRL